MNNGVRSRNQVAIHALKTEQKITPDSLEVKAMLIVFFYSQDICKLEIEHIGQSGNQK